MADDQLPIYGRAILGKTFREVRCPVCGKWLCDEYIMRGRIKLWCPKCARIVVMVYRKPKRSGEVDPLNK